MGDVPRRTRFDEAIVGLGTRLREVEIKLAQQNAIDGLGRNGQLDEPTGFVVNSFGSVWPTPNNVNPLIWNDAAAVDSEYPGFPTRLPVEGAGTYLFAWGMNVWADSSSAGVETTEIEAQCRADGSVVGDAGFGLTLHTRNMRARSGAVDEPVANPGGTGIVEFDGDGELSLQFGKVTNSTNRIKILHANLSYVRIDPV